MAPNSKNDEVIPPWSNFEQSTVIHFGKYIKTVFIGSGIVWGISEVSYKISYPLFVFSSVFLVSFNLFCKSKPYKKSVFMQNAEIKSKAWMINFFINAR